MIIRHMQRADLDFAAACTAAEGWTGGTRQDFEDLWRYDPRGCFIARQDGKKLGILTATSYGDYGFIGNLIVIPAARGQGTGRALLDNGIRYLRKRGTRSILLDGVVKALPLYERAGFRRVCQSLRFSGTIKGRSHPDVRAMRPEDLHAVCGLDRQAFRADRGFFLRRLLKRFPELCKVLERQGEICGYLMGRRSEGLIGLGPWVVHHKVDYPGILVESLAAESSLCRFSVGVLEKHAPAVALARALGFEERPNPPWRMALDGPAGLGASMQCYAIGAAAKG